MSAESKPITLSHTIKPVHFIIAVGEHGEFGFRGNLPWPRLPQDMQHFARTTSAASQPSLRNALLMGRRTWESIPPSLRPLQRRLNVVLSSQLDAQPSPDLAVASSVQQALQIADADPSVEAVFAIGGPGLLQALLAEHPARCHTLHLTRVAGTFEADTFLDCAAFLRVFSRPDPQARVQVTEEPSGVEIAIEAHRNPHFQPRHEEHQYLDLIREIIQTGTRRGDRTGVGTLAVFGKQLTFSLRNGQFPLLTTKQTFFRGVAEELIWFIHGCTDSKLLAEKNVHIWDANGSRAFLDSRGFQDREEGDLGPVYGIYFFYFLFFNILIF